MKDFFPNRERYEKWKTKSFQNAMNQIDEFITNSGNKKVSNPEATVLTIKQEKTTIKEEHDAFDTIAVSVPNNQMEPPSLNSVDTLEGMKDQKIKLVEELLKFKTENQGMYFELQQKHNQLDTLRDEKLATTVQIDRLVKESACARDEIECLKQTNVELMSMMQTERQSSKIEIQNHEKTRKTAKMELDRVTRENKMLSAQLKQMKSCSNENIPLANQDNDVGISKTHKIESETEAIDDVEYGVDSILSHRTRYGKRSFFVQWKNSWVAEKKLSCPKILNEYLKKINSKK